MLPLSPDESYNFELLRLLAHSSYGGADIGEVLTAAGEIEPGDFESWYRAFHKRAERVLAASAQFQNPVSIRDANFRAATYFRAADFYLHGNWEDPRITNLWKKQAACFDKAMALLDVPGYRKLLPADGFHVPIIFFPASKDEGVKRPTVILGNGFDGSMEELYHLHGAAALERGYNVVCYDGPGQPLVRREQGLGFTHEWEKVVGPVLDYLETLPSVDMQRVALMGYSMAGVLAARAAALDHRVKALLQIDGLYDFGDTPASKEAGSTFGNLNDVESTRIACNNLKIPAGLRWMLSHGLWSFKVQTRGEFLEKVKNFTLRGLEDKIECPVFVGSPEHDMFFKGQPEKMKEVLGDKATLVTLTDEDAAGFHCHCGAQRFVNAVMWEWFEDKIVNKASA
ncbi:alpha/beta-hydrolase [Xylariaceae sp. AK1471]|nr:alpha/beta-hydrolase [Xylariaceae sp. AK1471]